MYVRATAGEFGFPRPQSISEGVRHTPAGPMVRLLADPEPELPESEASDAPAEPNAPPTDDLQAMARRYASQFTAPLWNGILNYKFPDDSDLRARKAELLGELSEFIERVNAWFADAHRVKMAALAEEQESLRVQCREMKERMDALDVERAPVNAQLNAALRVSSKARVLLQAIDAAEPRPESWPSAAETARWRSSQAKARADLDLAQAEEDRINVLRNEFFREARTLKVALYGRDGKPGLKQRHDELCAQLGVKEYHDLATGLLTSPEF